jgi:hypothetical protein
VIADLFNTVQQVLDAFGLLFLVVRRRRTGFGLYALGSFSGLVGDVADGSRGWAVVDSAFAGFYVWAWWHSGGGDGTKRRLRSWTRRFRGVRRTAPVLGGA